MVALGFMGHTSEAAGQFVKSILYVVRKLERRKQQGRVISLPFVEFYWTKQLVSSESQWFHSAPKNHKPRIIELDDMFPWRQLNLWLSVWSEDEAKCFCFQQIPLCQRELKATLTLIDLFCLKCKSAANFLCSGCNKCQKWVNLVYIKSMSPLDFLYTMACKGTKLIRKVR